MWKIAANFLRSHCIVKIDRVSMTNRHKMGLDRLLFFSVSGNISLQGHMGSTSPSNHAELGSNVLSRKRWVRWRFSCSSDRTVTWNPPMTLYTGNVTQVCVGQTRTWWGHGGSTAVWAEWMNWFFPLQLLPVSVWPFFFLGAVIYLHIWCSGNLGLGRLSWDGCGAQHVEVPFYWQLLGG